MPIRARVFVPAVMLAGVSLAAACRHATSPNGTAPVAHLRVLNTSPGDGPVDVLVFGRVVIASLASGSVSPVVDVPAGAQAVSFRRAGAGAAGAASTVSFAVGDTTTLLTVDSGTVINPWELTDTGATVPAG
ncbi:MAG: DUF4397 domain-containing protein, partial [Gemmatimonadota bacterium]|nr:DUF4397 domain-containing protein [Gemmatimonadota bacterium]